MEWRALVNAIRWDQGEHVSIIGPTGSGKTTLAFQLLKKRDYIVLFAVKGRDATLDRYLKQYNYLTVRTWPPADDSVKRVALWPKFTGVSSFATQARTFRNAINGGSSGIGLSWWERLWSGVSGRHPGIFAEGGWTVVIDEVMYLTEQLGLTDEMHMLWTQGRSNGITVVASSQRPRDVPQLMLNQATHLFLFQVSDAYEVRRIAELTGGNAAYVRETLPTLGEHEFLYINTRRNVIERSKVTL